MAGTDGLSERELRVLEAVIQTYVETAEPAGSQTVARRFGLGVSSATIRAVMAELEEKGLLFHPHTSAGRVPTDRGYRLFVDGLMRVTAPSERDRETLVAELQGTPNAVEEVLRRTAKVLGVLTQELGVAVAPVLDDVVLERMELVPVAADRLLLVFTLRSGVVRTIFVQLPDAPIARPVLDEVSRVLNQRLAGLTLREIRASLPARLRDAAPDPEARELLNIFIAEGEAMFPTRWSEDADVLLGSAQLLAGQPEFTDSARMKGLLELTERRDLLRAALAERHVPGLTISIGSEHGDPRLADFTLVTGSYRAGDCAGVIGVMGPTRMPYEKVVAIVDHASRLVEGLLQ